MKKLLKNSGNSIIPKYIQMKHFNKYIAINYFGICELFLI